MEEEGEDKEKKEQEQEQEQEQEIGNVDEFRMRSKWRWSRRITW